MPGICVLRRVLHAKSSSCERGWGLASCLYSMCADLLKRQRGRLPGTQHIRRVLRVLPLPLIKYNASELCVCRGLLPRRSCGASRTPDVVSITHRLQKLTKPPNHTNLYATGARSLLPRGCSAPSSTRRPARCVSCRFPVSARQPLFTSVSALLESMQPLPTVYFAYAICFGDAQCFNCPILAQTKFIVVNNTELHRLAIMDPVVDGRLTGNVYYTSE